MKSKIRKILERNAFTDSYYEPEDLIIFERDFDKLEKELQEYLKEEVEEEVSGQWEYEMNKKDKKMRQ